MGLLQDIAIEQSIIRLVNKILLLDKMQYIEGTGN